VAAIVSSIANPPERGGDGDENAPAATNSAPAEAPASASTPAKTPEPRTIAFPATAKPETRKLEIGQPATLLVDVATPGQVDIPSLGLTDAAEPLTPAMFEVLATAKGSHPIVLQPAGLQALPSKIGTLKVVPAS
jgi:hypothetical protein